ncbi:50S ribosomal protein L14e [Candidatus Woesearchaeota archaeon]|nr:50S ribosomal protein L14e [Candidatus Woesearchaeota archaeon]
MIDVGRLCVKIAGRDAGKKCVVIEVLDNKFVLIDGETRRRKCNIIHLEPLDETISVEKGVSHIAVVDAFKKLGIELVEQKSKKKTVRPRTLRRSKLAEKPAELKATLVPKPSTKDVTSVVANVEKSPVAKKPRKKSVEKAVEEKK